MRHWPRSRPPPRFEERVGADLVAQPCLEERASTREGIGSYFPAFFPDGSLFYISNLAPKGSDVPKRFRFAVVDPDREVYFANLFADPARRDAAAAIGELWLRSCAPGVSPFKSGEAPWAFMSLSRAQCEDLVRKRSTGDAAAKRALLAACAEGR
jgi:hypothetical protein